MLKAFFFIKVSEKHLRLKKTFFEFTSPVVHRRLDKSYRIRMETRYVFHCATVSSSDNFGRAVSTLRTKKNWRESLGAILQ